MEKYYTNEKEFKNISKIFHTLSIQIIKIKQFSTISSQLGYRIIIRYQGQY